ncbi:MAG: UDP-N-acetylmuramate dehydrogenase [Eubacteriales bacterium]
MDSVDKLLNIAIGLNCAALKAAPMNEYTSFRIGGPVDLLIKPNSSVNFQHLLHECRLLELDYLVLGKGSNVLVSDSGIRGVVFCTTELNNCEYIGDNIIECDAGVGLSSLCNFALENEFSGIEFAYGIPGSAGGAVYMNAGAYGGEMKDVLLSCNHLTTNASFGSLEGNALDFSYRNSAYSSNGCIITSLQLRLHKGDRNEIKSRMNEIWESRKDKQPLEFPSAGSIFKHPKDRYAGAIIEECGLKGRSIGDAEVSVKHAGFIVNKGNATAHDVLKLIEIIKETVLSEKSIRLETEIKFI